MSLTLVTALTSFRVLAGVVGVGSALYFNQTKEGAFDFGEVPKAIFGEAIGGLFAQWLNEGNSLAYEQFLKRLETLDADALNHDLQRATAKAQIIATFFAVQSCLADIEADRKSLWESLKNKVWQDDDLHWLKQVSQDLKADLKKVDTATFDANLDYREIFGIFDPNNIAHDAVLQTQVADQLKQAVLSDVNNTYRSYFGGLFTVKPSPETFDLLQDKILNGWENFAEDADKIVQLKIEKRAGKKYDWFELVCLIFNEEYKSNPKIKAALDKQDRLEQRLLLQNVNASLQTSYGRLETKLADIIHQIADFREENFWLHKVTHQELKALRQEVKQGFEQILAENKSQTSIVVSNLPDLKVKVYDRADESEKLLTALRDGAERFYLVVAPSGFGKTFLLTKVLQAVVDERQIKPEYADKVKRIILIDCRLTQTLGKIVGDFSDLLGANLEYNPAAGETAKEWLEANLFRAISQTGTTWLILENFESWLDAANGYKVKESEPRSFLNALFDGNHAFRVLIISQAEPDADVTANLHKLEEISEGVANGLPESDALDYLRTEDKTGVLQQTDEALLKDFLNRICRIPQALNSLVGYLKTKQTEWKLRGRTFADFMADEVMWASFDDYEDQPMPENTDEQNKALRRTKALIARQISAQSDDIKLPLLALAFFNQPVPVEALEMLSVGEDSFEPLRRLIDHRLATMSEGRRGTVRIELHTYFAKEARNPKVLPPFESFSENLLVDYVEQLFLKGYEADKDASFRRAIDFYQCMIKILECLVKNGRKTFENPLIHTYIYKSNALQKSGKLPEAITEYDKAIVIQERLVNDENCKELENELELARMYMNKSGALVLSGNLSEALIEYDKVIAIYERPVNEEERDELASKLAEAYWGKGITLGELGKLPEEIAELEKAIVIYEKLINEEGRGDLVKDLAATYANKGTALAKSGKSSEAIAEYDKTILIYERLVNDEKRDDLANGLATAYMNKGAALSMSSGKLSEAIAEYDKTILIYERLVNDEKRDDLASDLAKAYFNKARALENLPDWENALDHYEKSVSLLVKCVMEFGWIQVVPVLMQTVCHLFVALFKLEWWETAGLYATIAVWFMKDYYKHPALSEHHRAQTAKEFGRIIYLMRETADKNRKLIYAVVGADGEFLRQIVEHKY